MPESGKGASHALKYASFALLAVYPFLYYGMYAGDAMIHLVYAENAAAGRFFEFNPGEKSAGVTSPGYMLLVTGLFRLTAPEAVPISRQVVEPCRLVRTTVCESSPGSHNGPFWQVGPRFPTRRRPHARVRLQCDDRHGERSLCAGRLCFHVAGARLPAAPTRCKARVGSRACECRLARVGCMAATRGRRGRRSVAMRPDATSHGGMAGLGECGWAFSRKVPPSASSSLASCCSTNHHTGYWLPTSGLSRVLMAARESASLGPLIVHPRFALRLVAYLPVTLLFAIGSIVALRNRREAPERAFLVAMFWTFFVLYSVVLGAVHVGRYVIFLMPLYGTIALSTALGMVARPPKALGRSVTALLACSVCWMGGVYWIEATQRLKLGGWSALWDLADAPRNRTAASDALIRQLGAPTRRPITLAFQEVQARYWLDERFVVRSLDGRTDRRLLRFANRREVDHLAYIRDRGVDFLMELPNYNRSDSRLYTLDRLRGLPPGGTCEREGLRFRRLGLHAIVSVEPTRYPDQDVACP